MEKNGKKINGMNGSNGNEFELLEMLRGINPGGEIEYPLVYDAFYADDETKMQKIESHFREIMKSLGLDLSDESLKGTPKRIAKMFVKEIFYGLDPGRKPAMTTFDNNYKYGQMLIEKNITVRSTCEHHFLPIYGKAHIAYISSGKVIGLSKLNRIVDYYASRPQVQERLTRQIAEDLKKSLNTEDVAVIIEASHMCVLQRGIKDHDSTTITSEYAGKFQESQTRQEFIQYIGMFKD